MSIRSKGGFVDYSAKISYNGFGGINMNDRIIAVKSSAPVRYAVILYMLAAALVVAAVLCATFTAYPAILVLPAAFAALFAAAGIYFTIAYVRLPYALITYDGNKLAFYSGNNFVRVSPENIEEQGGQSFGSGYACSKCNTSSANSGYSFGEYSAKTADGQAVRVKWCKDISGVTRAVATIVLDAKEKSGKLNA